MPNIHKVFAEASQVVAAITSAAVNASSKPAEGAYVAIGAAMGALSTLACVVGHVEGEDVNASDWNPGKRITNDTILFSSLLVAASMSPVVADSKNVDIGGRSASEISAECHFGTAAVLDAMTQFERLTGRKPDSFLDPNMVRQVRKATDEGKVMLDQFLASRVDRSKLH